MSVMRMRAGGIVRAVSHGHLEEKEMRRRYHGRMRKRKSTRTSGKVSEQIQERAPFPRDSELWQATKLRRRWLRSAGADKRCLGLGGDGEGGSGGAGVDADRQAVARAKRNGEERDDGRIREQSEAVALRNGGKE